MKSLLPKLSPINSNHVGWPWTEATAPTIYETRVDWPRISIITPSFNQGEFIEETIRSVLLQNYPNLQYIVIDGGSTDNTKEILERYSPWIDFWESTPDSGQSDAVNKGIKLANGTWVNWLNSDDTLLPGALHAMTSAVESDESIRIVSGSTQNVREGECFGRYSTQFIPNSPQCFFQLGVNQPGSLMRRDQVKSVGALRPELHLCMDLDLWERLLLEGGPTSIKLIPEQVATYRYHADSKTCSDSDVFALEEFVLLHDLSLALGSTMEAQLAEARRISPIEKLTYISLDQHSSEQIDRALLDRLLVSDSLLFRAILRGNTSSDVAIEVFQRLLKKLIPRASQLFDLGPAQLEAQALLRAQQAVGRLLPRIHLRIMRMSPGMQSIIEGLRLARLSFK